MYQVIPNHGQVEARGSALERLREENESLTENYNRLRGHSVAMEEQAQAKVTDLERQLADACRKAAEAGVVAAAAHARAHQNSSVSLKVLAGCLAKTHRKNGGAWSTCMPFLVQNAAHTAAG